MQANSQLRLQQPSQSKLCPAFLVTPLVLLIKRVASLAKHLVFLVKHLVILVKTAVVFALTFRFSGLSRCGKRQKKAEEGWLVSYNYVSHTFATHSSPVYDVTDTDSWAENGSAQGRVFAIFKPRFSTNKQCQNSSEKLKFCVSRTPQFFPFLSVGPVKTF